MTVGVQSLLLVEIVAEITVLLAQLYHEKPYNDFAYDSHLSDDNKWQNIWSGITEEIVSARRQSFGLKICPEKLGQNICPVFGTKFEDIFLEVLITRTAAVN